ncbi:neuropeptide SIFamide receptor [Caerostris darwini]|uniref:Neuropeptide SIFamide receptor n=1 Tax=Caerostris darwini TaxID=1538125 RepID=A0AAV4S3X3_9ARAC|nr:neuropeptide SIFamide receptor [Caerostris darwini]
MCKAVAYLQGVSVCASVTTLVAISVDRFLAICYPMTWQITSRGCHFIIGAIWTFSITLTLPWMVYFRLIQIGRTTKNDNLYVCREIWPTESMGVTYFIVANLILCYLLPLFIILLCYGFIWLKVWRRKLPGEGIHNNGIKVGDPYPENSMEEFIIQVFAPVAQWLGASNSCINPVLYAFFNAKLRAGFKAVLFGKKPCCSTNGGNMVQMSSRKTTSARCPTGNLSKKGSAKENAI